MLLMFLFVADSAIETSTCAVDALFHGVWVKYPGFTQTDFCKQLDKPYSCPVKPGSEVIYHTTVSIPAAVPSFVLPEKVRETVFA